MRSFLKRFSLGVVSYILLSLVFPILVLAQPVINAAVNSDTPGNNIDISVLFNSFGWGKYYAIFTTVTSILGFAITQAWPFIRPPTTQSSVLWTFVFNKLNIYVMANHHYAVNAIAAPSIAEVKAAKS